jgi:hypothetical protein
MTPADLRFIHDRVVVCRDVLLDDGPIGDDGRALALLAGMACELIAARDCLDADAADGVDTDHTVYDVADHQLRVAIGYAGLHARIMEAIVRSGEDALPPPDFERRVMAKIDRLESRWWRKAWRWLKWR